MKNRRHCARKRITREELMARVGHLNNLISSTSNANLTHSARDESAECFELRLDDFVARCEAQLRYAKLLQADVRGMEELPPAVCCTPGFYEFNMRR
jgi:hypothetical protein